MADQYILCGLYITVVFYLMYGFILWLQFEWRTGFPYHFHEIELVFTY